MYNLELIKAIRLGLKHLQNTSSTAKKMAAKQKKIEE